MLFGILARCFDRNPEGWPIAVAVFFGILMVLGIIASVVG